MGTLAFPARVQLGFALALTALVAPCCASRSVRDAAVPATRTASHATVEWADWKKSTFETASAEDRIILINVVATWCHWCHVMEEETYADPEVAELLAEHFVTIRIDSDARPDIAERYRAWGWPATAVLTPNAAPVTALRGYRNPRVFAAFLRELVADRDAGTLRQRTPPDAAASEFDADLEALRTRATAQLDDYFEPELGGWGQTQKYPFAAPVEHAFARTFLHPDQDAWAERALLTLQGTAELNDPVWGGVYQYSLNGDWKHPHFEKITAIQAGAIENFALASRVTGNAKWIGQALAVRKYMNSFMRDGDGGYYTSQDADLRQPDAPAVVGADYYANTDADRWALGVPRIDDNVYADLNGLMIRSLTELYAATGDPRVLQDAISAAEALLVTHRTPHGAFVHGADDDPAGLLYLRDQANMGFAFVGLYRVTLDPRWLDEAKRTAEFITGTLGDERGGFFSHTEDPAAVGVFAERRKPVEENAIAARFFLGLHRYTADGTKYFAPAKTALEVVGEPTALRAEGRIIGNYLLAVEEALMPTVDVTVVGAADSSATDDLFADALRLADPRFVIERSVPGERYPDVGAPAIYMCTASACSPPIKDGTELRSRAAGFVASLAGG